MYYTTTYSAPVGLITLASNGDKLVGLWNEGQKYFGSNLSGQMVAVKMKRESMSSQAVGGAVGRNPISIVIPCHRVVGTSGSLTGYAGGLDTKIQLLEIEGVDTSQFNIPTRGAAL